MVKVSRAAALFLLAACAHALKLPSLQRKKQVSENDEDQFFTTPSPSMMEQPRTPPPDQEFTAKNGEPDRGETRPPTRSQPSPPPELEPELPPEQPPEQPPELPQQTETETASRTATGQPENPAGPARTDNADTIIGNSSPEEPRPPGQTSHRVDESTVEQTAPFTAPPQDTIQSNRQVAPILQQVDQPKVLDAGNGKSDVVPESTTRPVPVTREPVPDDAYAVFDKHGQICILATLMVDLEIIYYTRQDQRKKVTLRLPEDADVTGACARDGALPKIVFSWDDVKFSIMFSENELGNKWYVNEMKLSFGMDNDNFPDAAKVERQDLWMDVQKQHTLHLFGSPVDKAYYCTSEQDLDLYNGDGIHSATLILWNLHLQPYVMAGEFGPSVNCPGGKVGRRRINENVPLAVGSTLASVTLVTVAGYAVYRHFKVKKFNYDTME